MTTSTLATLTIGGEPQAGAAGSYPVHNPARPVIKFLTIPFPFRVLVAPNCARRYTPLATGAELGENVASARFPGELPAGAGGADALVENERLGKRAELGSRLLHRD